MIKLKMPETMTTCSHNGVQYEGNEDGIITVPDDAVTALKAHGLVTLDEHAVAQLVAAEAADVGASVNANVKRPLLKKGV